MVVKQLKLFESGAPEVNSGNVSGTSQVTEHGNHEIGQLFQDIGMNNKSSIIGNEQVLRERKKTWQYGIGREFYLLLGQVETIDEVISLRKKYIDSFSERHQRKVDNLCQDRINQIKTSQGLSAEISVFDDPMKIDQLENELEASKFTKQVDDLIIMLNNQTITNHIEEIGTTILKDLTFFLDKIQNTSTITLQDHQNYQSTIKKRDNLGDCLVSIQELIKQNNTLIDDDGNEIIQESNESEKITMAMNTWNLQDEDIQHSINQCEIFKKSIIIQDFPYTITDLIELYNTINNNSSGQQKTILLNTDNLLKLDDKIRKYRNYLSINGMFYSIRRDNTYKGSSPKERLRCFLSLEKKKPGNIFTPIEWNQQVA